MHIQISVTISPDKIDLLSDIFMELGADAVSMTDAKDEPLFQLSPEDQPCWQQTTVHALFDQGISAEDIVNNIKKNNIEFQPCHFYIEKIGEKNWVEETQKHFHAQEFNGLWICPQWEKEKFINSHKKETVVFIEPGLAFGTGTHPTTQLCLTWLADQTAANSSVFSKTPVSNLRGKTIVDYGCGSGILALGALALGAPIVYATDHDAQALESTLNNAKYNDFKNTALYVKKTNEMDDIKADIILANILANPLITLAPILTKLLLPNGKLILSGVLEIDADRVFAAYQDHFDRVDTQHKDGWVLMELHHKE